MFDVVVDICRGSSTFGHHMVVELIGRNHHQLFISRGYAYVFSVLSEEDRGHRRLISSFPLWY